MTQPRTASVSINNTRIDVHEGSFLVVVAGGDLVVASLAEARRDGWRETRETTRARDAIEFQSGGSDPVLGLSKDAALLVIKASRKMRRARRVRDDRPWHKRGRRRG